MYNIMSLYPAHGESFHSFTSCLCPSISFHSVFMQAVSVFPHSVHGLHRFGLEVHEAPTINPTVSLLYAHCC